MVELALLSFDALDPRVIYDKREQLPNFNNLLDNTMHGKWNTPGHTLPSYTSTLTGKTTSTHLFWWDDPENGYSRHRETGHEYLWETIDASMSLLNIPVLYPPEKIDDAMICGFTTPDDVANTNLARPVEVQKHLNEINYVHDVPADETYEELGGEQMLKLSKDIMNTRTNVAQWLLNKYDSELFYAVWTLTDRWFHQARFHDESFMPLYKQADKELGKMLDSLSDDVPLIVFSDHGFDHFGDGRGTDGHGHHEYQGFYAIRNRKLPNCRDDSLSIHDLYPTVVNYFGGETPEMTKGRIIFHTDEQDEQVKDRLRDLGYLE